MQENGRERTAHVERQKITLLQVHPLPFFSITSCPLLLCFFFLFLSLSLSLPPSPSLLFVPGMYQPDRERRRREGGGVSQHVRQGRGGKRERIACGRGTEKSDSENGRRAKLIFFFSIWFPHSISCCESDSLLKFCWVAFIRDRKTIRERRENIQDGASQWKDDRKGKMEEMKADPLKNPPNHHVHLSFSNTAAAADIIASTLSLNPTLGELYSACERKSRADIYVLLRGIVFWTLRGRI